MSEHPECVLTDGQLAELRVKAMAAAKVYLDEATRRAARDSCLSEWCRGDSEDHLRRARKAFDALRGW